MFWELLSTLLLRDGQNPCGRWFGKSVAAVITLIPLLWAQVASASDSIVGPGVPEPMVFDLVRPLGVREGELEFNVISLVPFRREQKSTQGLFPSVEGTESDRPAKRELGPVIEWAPEVEWAPIDDLAIEFEVPFSEERIAEYKMGIQWSFTPSTDNSRISGLQLLVNTDADGGSTTPTFLYLWAARFAPTYSAQVMAGARTTLGSRSATTETDFVLNPTVYKEVTSSIAFGVEGNTTTSERGRVEALVMPQATLSLTRSITLQMGVGARVVRGDITGESGFRLIGQL